MPLVLQEIKRPGRSDYAGFGRVVQFIGRRDNLHRYNGSSGEGHSMGREKVLMRRTAERSVLYAKFAKEEREAGRTPCSSRFFYEVCLGDKILCYHVVT